MTRPLFLARLAGTQEQMGAQHGALTVRDAQRLLAFYRTMPERQLAGDLGVVNRLLVRGIATGYQARLLRERPPEFAARTRAYAKAIGSPRGAELAMAVMDSMQNTVSVAARLRQGPFAPALTARGVAAAMPACSTAIAWGRTTVDGELLFGRNFDFPGVGVWDAAPAFVVCVPDRGQRYGFFATRGADTPVVTCVNEAGLVMAPHTRWHKDVTFGGAMIVDVVHAIASRAETIEDAIRIARERPASSSWGIAIGSAREKTACVLELAGPHVEVVRPTPGADFLVCTNRYRTPALQAGQLTASHAWVIQPDRREQRLRQLIEHRTGPIASPGSAGARSSPGGTAELIDAQMLARFMGDRIDPAAPDRVRHLGGILAQALNVHCVVVAPGEQRAHVGVDRAPCCEGTWADVRWQWDGPAGGWELGGPGFDVRTLDDFVAPQDAATRHLHDATRVYETSHDVPAARRAFELAIAAAPDDPSLRLAAAWLALEDRDPACALVHIRAGLEHETEAYRRGQLLLWGVRAAPRENSWREELARLQGDGVDELRAALRTKHSGRPHANLMMVDAY